MFHDDLLGFCSDFSWDLCREKIDGNSNLFIVGKIMVNDDDPPVNVDITDGEITPFLYR